MSSGPLGRMRTSPGHLLVVLSRTYWALLAALLTFTLVAQLFVTLDINGVGTSTKLIRLVSYFTVQSNILVCATSWALAARPFRRETWWRVLRLDAIAGIVVTGVVYALVLAGTQELHGWALFCDIVFHYVSPAATLVGWLLLGPRGRVDRRVCALALIWPVAWFAYTLLHGAVSSWYPYHFIDVDERGYGSSLLAALLVTILLGVVFCLIWYVDRRSPSFGGRRPTRRSF